MDLEFIQELTEARLYRSRDTLKGKTAEELAKTTFLMIMMIEILRSEESAWTKNYVINTRWNEDFKAMLMQASDLHNLITILNNQEKFQDKITIDKTISPPIFMLKTYFRNIENGRKEHGWDRGFFKKLEEFLKIKDSSLREIRRAVADWNLNSDSEKRTVRHQIKNILMPTNQQNDLVLYFKDKLRG